MDATRATRRSITKDDNFRGVSLAYLVEKEPQRMWPTPCATDYKGSVSLEKWGGYDMKTKAKKAASLRNIPVFPTPGCSGLSNGSGNCEKANQLFEQGVISEEERRAFRAGNGGQLNPDWEEWLMGWPKFWSRLDPLPKESMDSWHGPGEWPEDPAEDGTVPRTVEDMPYRRERVMAIGNGQVPQSIALFMQCVGDIEEEWE